TSSYFRLASAGSKPRGDGAPPPACASWIGDCACAGVTAPAATALPETMKSRRERSMTASLLAQLSAAVGDDIQKRADLGREMVDVGREEAARGGGTGARLRTDRHHAGIADVTGGVGRLPFRVQQVLLADHNQRLGLDRAQGFDVIAGHAGRGPDVVS